MTVSSGTVTSIGEPGLAASQDDCPPEDVADGAAVDAAPVVGDGVTSAGFWVAVAEGIGEGDEVTVGEGERAIASVSRACTVW